MVPNSFNDSKFTARYGDGSTALLIEDDYFIAQYNVTGVSQTTADECSHLKMFPFVPEELKSMALQTVNRRLLQKLEHGIKNSCPKRYSCTIWDTQVTAHTVIRKPG